MNPEQVVTLVACIVCALLGGGIGYCAGYGNAMERAREHYLARLEASERRVLELLDRVDGALGARGSIQ